MLARLDAIFIKRYNRGPMDSRDRARLVAGRGIEGNANQGGTRQVTVISRERWEELTRVVAADLGPSARRANLVISGLNLAETAGRVLLVGICRLRIVGETRPCERMEEAAPGLQAAMRERWAGGVYGVVLDDGEIVVGDEVRWNA
jgi:MOSC domain-containing protein YiiM